MKVKVWHFLPLITRGVRASGNIRRVRGPIIYNHGNALVRRSTRHFAYTFPSFCSTSVSLVIHTLLTSICIYYLSSAPIPFILFFLMPLFLFVMVFSLFFFSTFCFLNYSISFICLYIFFILTKHLFLSLIFWFSHILITPFSRFFYHCFVFYFVSLIIQPPYVYLSYLYSGFVLFSIFSSTSSFLSCYFLLFSLLPIYACLSFHP